MFKGTIQIDQLPLRNIHDGGSGLGSLADSIELHAYSHPLIESRRFSSPNHLLILAREKATQAFTNHIEQLPKVDLISDEALIKLSIEVKSWPMDWQTIRIDLPECEIILSAGTGGVAPMYVGFVDDSVANSLMISWSIADFYPYLSLLDVDHERLGLLVLGTTPYSAKTVFHSVHMVTERAMICVKAGKIVVEYPTNAIYYQPTALKQNADIVGNYCDLLRTVISRWPLDQVTTSSEFSGGMDSALIARISSENLLKPLLCNGLEIEGAARPQQSQRRASAIEKFGFRDLTFDIAQTSAVPVELKFSKEYVPTPYNADLQQPLHQLWKNLRQEHGVRAMLTGTGGDELLMRHYFEFESEDLAKQIDEAYLPRQLPDIFKVEFSNGLSNIAKNMERAPYSVLPISVLEANAARAPLFLTYGMWSINPFAQPETVRFCRCLPLEWRKNKRLHSVSLERLEFPADYLEVPLRENFIPYLFRSFFEIRSSVLTQFQQSCRLAELEIIDVIKFADFAERIVDETQLHEMSYFYHVLNTELILQRLGTSKNLPHASR